MVVPRWRMLPVPFFVINDVIMTSLLLLKIVCVSQLLDTLSVYFEGNLDSDYKFNDMTS